MSQPAETRMGVSDVRANMTEVLAEVRLLGTPVVLTRRDKPQAALVSVGFYEQALRDRAVIEFLEQRVKEGETGKTADVRLKAEALHVALRAAERDVNAALNAASEGTVEERAARLASMMKNIDEIG